MAAEGKSRREILETLEISSTWFSAHRNRNPPFDREFARAERDGLELLADDLKTVHERYRDVQRGRLVSDNSKFLLSKRIPHIYGDKLDINVTERVDVGGALLEARKRAALPARDQHEADDTQDAEYWELPASEPNGSEPSGEDEEGDIFS